MSIENNENFYRKEAPRPTEAQGLVWLGRNS